MLRRIGALLVGPRGVFWVQFGGVFWASLPVVACWVLWIPAGPFGGGGVLLGLWASPDCCFWGRFVWVLLGLALLGAVWVWWGWGVSGAYGWC